MLFQLLLLACKCKVVIKDNIIVVLLDVAFQPKVLTQEPHQLVTGPIVSNQSRLAAHVSQHDVKETFAVASALHLGINVEIEDGQRFHFVHLASAPPHEKLLVANFDEANSLVTLCFDEQDVLVCLQLA